MRGGDRRLRSAAAAARQRPGAGGDAEAFEEEALRHGAEGAGRAGGLGEGAEADVGGEVGLAGVRRAGRRRRGRRTACSVSPCAVPGAVVDEERGAAVAGDAGAEVGGDGFAPAAQTSATAPSGRWGKRASRAASGRGGGPARKPSPRADVALAPEGVGALELADGEGVEELVGDEEERAGRQVVDAVGPARRGSARAAAWRGAERGAGLDEPEPGGGAEAGLARRRRAGRRASACRGRGRARRG